MAAPALNPLAVACAVALLVVTAGAARTMDMAQAPAPTSALAPASDEEPAMMPGSDEEPARMCHSNNGWSKQLCVDTCTTSGAAGYQFRVRNEATGGMARCCCCLKSSDHDCITVAA
ncbi:hypothetical protein ACP4OV_006082 [Aristida adscensionis]